MNRHAVSESSESVRSENSGRIFKADFSVLNDEKAARVFSLPRERSWLSCHSDPVGASGNKAKRRNDVFMPPIIPKKTPLFRA